MIKMKIKKILVTGSSGTIGTRLCEFLLENKYTVVGVDCKQNKWSKKIQDITLNIDLRNKEDVLTKIPKDVDLVIHLAANARVYNLVVDPSLARDNFEIMFNVLEYTRINNIKKVMFSSSREVYGNSKKTLNRENDVRINNCESPYTASKIGGEVLVQAYQRCYDINFIIFRFSNVYGMYDDSDRIIPLFIKLCKDNKDLIIYGEDKLLDFTYIDDVIFGILLCINKFDEIKNNIFNLASGEGTSLLDVANLIRTSLKVNNKIKIRNNRVGEVINYVANISKFSKLGYNPKTNIMTGINKFIKWYSLNLKLKI